MPPTEVTLPPHAEADDLELDSHEDRDPRPGWRREVAYRLDIYKARRQHLCAEASRGSCSDGRTSVPVARSAARGTGSSSTRASNPRPTASKSFSPPTPDRAVTDKNPVATKNSALNEAAKNTPASANTTGRAAKKMVSDVGSRPGHAERLLRQSPPAASQISPRLPSASAAKPGTPTPDNGAGHAAKRSVGEVTSSSSVIERSHSHSAPVTPVQTSAALPPSASAAKASPAPPRSRLRWQDHLEIDVAQPSLNFTGASYYPSDFPVAATGHYSWSDSPHSPAAPLTNRLFAGAIDAAFLAFFYGGFLALFWALGGRFSVSTLGVAVTAATFCLIYAQYFLLFTILGGATPGMMVRRLRIVGFDGGDPAPAQLMWRCFGYIASAALALLGFAWSIWDQDHLTWHDRLSQTYLIPR